LSCRLKGKGKIVGWKRRRELPRPTRAKPRRVCVDPEKTELRGKNRGVILLAVRSHKKEGEENGVAGKGKLAHPRLGAEKKEREVIRGLPL